MWSSSGTPRTYWYGLQVSFTAYPALKDKGSWFYMELPLPEEQISRPSLWSTLELSGLAGPQDFRHHIEVVSPSLPLGRRSPTSHEPRSASRPFQLMMCDLWLGTLLLTFLRKSKKLNIYSVLFVCLFVL
jgi:hypothetical protein